MCFDIFDNLFSGVGLRFCVCEEGDGVPGGESVDVGVYLLDVEEDSREWGGEVNGGVGWVVSC